MRRHPCIPAALSLPASAAAHARTTSGGIPNRWTPALFINGVTRRWPLRPLQDWEMRSPGSWNAWRKVFRRR
ncbi:MAG TPA: hypothetical protein VHI13_15320 [Candidatus Kapabacteria bacterium]|nr:hypothetical protein [Candidatus Kapabacteria bacterium]